MAEEEQCKRQKVFHCTGFDSKGSSSDVQGLFVLRAFGESVADLFVYNLQMSYTNTFCLAQMVLTNVFSSVAVTV